MELEGQAEIMQTHPFLQLYKITQRLHLLINSLIQQVFIDYLIGT